jgi:hypothetical protein
MPFFRPKFIDSGVSSEFGAIHRLPEAPVLILEFLHLRHQRKGHAGEFCTLLIKRGAAGPLLLVRIKNRRTIFGLL